jgi:hypothetical protein
MRRLALLLTALGLGGCAAVPKPAAPGPLPLDPPYAAWARVLERHVDDQGRVAFAALARDRGDLDAFVRYVYEVSPETHPERFPSREAALAFHFNAYNALAMHKVIERGIPETLAGLRKLFFFFFGPVQVGGQRMSLSDYENQVIRAYDEPRLHFALNCMSVGCPRLPREPFLPDALTQQLERETRFFFSESRNLRVDDSARTVYVSEILRFYTEDFLKHAPSLIAYINRYVATPIPEDYQVRFIDYDWTIVRQPGDRA